MVAPIGAGGKVERIYPTSSGKASTPTIPGTFRVPDASSIFRWVRYGTRVDTYR